MPEAGYTGIGPESGTYVSEADAYTYAIDRCLNGSLEEQEDFQKEIGPLLVEWYYSGNWIKEEED